MNALNTLIDACEQPGAPQSGIDFMDWFIATARTNYAAFVSLTHRPRFTHSAFSKTVCTAIDQFVDDLLAGKNPVLMLTAPPQHGKQFAGHTPILTQNRGWVTHGELVRGDVLFRPDGSTTRVVAIGASQPSNARVTFSDGTVLDTHTQHEWQMRATWVNKRPVRVVETQDMIAKGVWNGVQGRRGARANFSLPDTSPLHGPAVELPIAPYTLGAWLGDGKRTTGRVTVAEQDLAVIDGIIADGYAWERYHLCNERDIHAEFPSLQRALRDSGIQCQGMGDPKRIPDAYFTASYAQRLELLAGLIDSDGYVYPANGRVTFSNAEPELVRDVERLVSTFGWRVSTDWQQPRLSSSGIQGRKPTAQVCFQPDVVIPCRLPRYRDAFKPGALKRSRAVTCIETGDFGWGNCIQVEHPDGMYLVGDRLIPTHNSSLISRCLAPYLYGRLTGKLPAVRIANATYALPLARRNATDAKSIMLEPMYRAIFPALTLIGFKGNQNTSSDFDVPLGGQFRAVGIGGPLTGFSVDIGIVDDATKNAEEALSPVVQDGIEAWFDSVLLTRLQQVSGLVIIGTPWAARDILGRVKKKYAGQANFKLLSFPALNCPGEHGYNPDLPEGALVPSLHSEAKLLATKRVMSDFWWAALYQQTPLSDVGAIFPLANVQYYRRAELNALRFVQTVMTVDATFKDGTASDYVAVGVWGKTADDRVWLLGHRRARLAFLATAQAIADLKARFPRVGKIYIEEAANGAALLDMLRKHYPNLEGLKPTGSKEARAHAVSWVWTNSCVMLPHPEEDAGIQAWVDEITMFPDVEHDDTVDCMVHALNVLCARTPISALITRDILNRA